MHADFVSWSLSFGCGSRYAVLYEAYNTLAMLNRIAYSTLAEWDSKLHEQTPMLDVENQFEVQTNAITAQIHVLDVTLWTMI